MGTVTRRGGVPRGGPGRPRRVPAPRLKPVSEQVVVLMGASSGIGRAAALRFAERGAQVVVAARSEGALDSLVDEIRAAGGQAVAVVADVTEPEQVRAVADRAVQQYGRLDTWIHLAAVALFAPFERTTPEEFERVLKVNLLGQVHGAWAALPHLRERGGAFVSVTSMGARRSVPLQSAYCSAKHGIDGFLETLRMEVRRERLPVSITNVLPATINTPLFDQSRSKIGVKPTAPPPVYPPDVVVDVLVHVAAHPRRDVVVGGAAKALIVGQQLSPRLLDALMVRFGFEVHDTGEPKSEQAPDNLFAPLDRYASAEGSLRSMVLQRSAYTWLQLHPVVTRLALAAAVGGLLRSRLGARRQGVSSRLVGSGG